MTTNFENAKTSCMSYMISDSSIQKLMNLVRRYDRFTCYIDSYKQEQQAIENNKLIAAQFINTIINMGIDITEAEFLNIVNKTGTVYSAITVEDAVMELLDKELSCYDNSHDITSIKTKAIAFYQKKFSGNRHSTSDYWYRIISSNKDYYVDVNLNTSGKYEAFFTPNAYGEIDFCANKELIAIYDFENNVEYTLDNNTIKEDNNMTTVKENQTNVKEETKMTTNAQNNNSLQKAKAILERINNNPKIQDKGYLDRDTLKEVLEPFEFGFTRKTTRKQMIERLVAYIKEQKDLLDEVAWENEPYDYPRVKEAIYKATILKANKNQQHNFISNWIFTSVVAEAVIGKPLKEVNNGVVVENYKSFTEVERELIKKVRSRFLDEAQWVKVIKKVKYGDKMVDELRGYTIPAKSIVYGRHKWLGVACVYKFDQHTTTGINTIEYHVSLNGIENTQTGVVTPLTDESYAKLDELCTFVR